MNLIEATVKAAVPSRRKITPSGWESFNAVCCHHRGEKADKRGRGGIMFTKDGFNYHCFNCNFKAGWVPGKLLSENTRKFMGWLGIADENVQKLALEAIRQKDESIDSIKIPLTFDLELRELPENCKTINQWINEGCEHPDFLEVVSYILERGMKLEWYPFMWSDSLAFHDRVIIPFYQEGMNGTVGWIARKLHDGKPKYLKSMQPGYVFNLDRQTHSRKYVILVEGNFDAIAIDGIAVMSNEVSEVQLARIKALGCEIVVVPDRDKAGMKLLDTAVEHGWSVSLPEWGDDIKDAADAVKKYGRTYTLFTILKYRVNSPIHISMLKRKVENAATKDHD